MTPEGIRPMAAACRHPVARLAVRWSAGIALGCAGLAAGFGPGSAAADVPNSGAPGAAETAVIRTWQGRTLDVMPLVENGAGGPELKLAQRSITRDLGKKTDMVGPETQYAYVDIAGWKSPGQASMMSLVVPGTGQIYAGSTSRGVVFLGVEAVAAFAYVKYNNDSHGKQDQYFKYVGDPNDPSSRFSFARLDGSVPPEELARLEAIYAKDPREFYDMVSTVDTYAGGWGDPDPGVSPASSRSTAQSYIEEVESLGRKSNVGLYTMIANHLVAAADALHLTKMNNFALRQNLSLKIKVRPGLHQSYGMTLTQKF
jgi:hypothetical protein